MGKLVAKIVLTGGPCAGKTTTITKIEEHLIEKGYHVLVVNECATEMIQCGIRPFGENAATEYDFENEILNLQLYKEKRYHSKKKRCQSIKNTSESPRHTVSCRIAVRIIWRKIKPVVVKCHYFYHREKRRSSGSKKNHCQLRCQCEQQKRCQQKILKYPDRSVKIFQN